MQRERPLRKVRPDKLSDSAPEPGATRCPSVILANRRSGDLDHENEGTPMRYVISMRARPLRSALAVSAVAGILTVAFLVNGAASFRAEY